MPTNFTKLAQRKNKCENEMRIKKKFCLGWRLMMVHWAVRLNVDINPFEIPSKSIKWTSEETANLLATHMQLYLITLVGTLPQNRLSVISTIVRCNLRIWLSFQSTARIKCKSPISNKPIWAGFILLFRFLVQWCKNENSLVFPKR